MTTSWKGDTQLRKKMKRILYPIAGSIALMLTSSNFVKADTSTGQGSTSGTTSSGTSITPTSKLTWMSMNTTPPAGGVYNAAMVYNPVADNVMMFGGMVRLYSSSVDLWMGWNWSTIRPPASSSSPANMGFFTGAYDPLTKQVVLFGDGNDDGIGDYGMSNTTLIWTGQRWNPVRPSKTPSSRAGAVMTYDAATKQILLFGGSQKTSSGWKDLNDIWVWKGSTWTQLNPKTSPSARSFAGMAYDAKIRRVVLFGGQHSNGTAGALNDMWTWDGKTWTKVNETTAPGARADASFAYDPKLGDIVLFGGETFTSSGALSPLNDTWLWDGKTWTELHPAASPPARYGAAMAYDEDTGRMLMYGGVTSQDVHLNMPVDNPTWVFDLPYSTPITTGSISVSADPSFPPTTNDIVKVTGLQSGDSVKIYSANAVPLGQVAATSTLGSSTNDVTATVYVPNMYGSGYLLATVTQPGLSESLPVGIQVPQLRTYPPMNIKVVNNDEGTPDTVAVTGQSSGDIIKVYADSQGKTLLGTATADSSSNTVVSIPQIGIGAGTLYLSATHGDLAESTFVKVPYPAEVTPTPTADNVIATMVDSTYKLDIVLVKGLQAGAVVKIYSTHTGGKLIAQGTELPSNHEHTGYTMIVIPHSAVLSTMYFSVTDPLRTESPRTVFNIET